MASGKAISSPDFNGLRLTNIGDGSTSTDAASKGQVDTNYTNAISRANHTGTQVASTISDFDTQVRTSRLDQLAAPSNPVNLNSQRATNLLAATLDTDAAQWGQVKDLISGKRKSDVRVVATSNVTLSSPGSSFDGQTIASGDSDKRILLTGQTNGYENGIYDWNGAASALTRSADADTAAEFGTAWLVSVTTGTTNGDTVWQHTTDGTITLGTTNLTFSKLGPIASTPTDGYTTTSPTTSAGGSWTVTHNLGTKYVLAMVARVASPYDFVSVYIERTTSNTLTVKPDIAMSSGEYEIMVKKVA